MTEHDSAIIRVDGVQKVYRSISGKKTVALQDVSLQIKRGEFVALLGPSGCGKSTLLRTIGGLDKATAGTVLVDGQLVTMPSPKVGVVFQRSVLLPWRTILDNVLLPAEVARTGRGDYQDRAHTLLAAAGLAEFTDSYPRELSGGMQQRAAICRALLMDPPILLMDEPYGALDAITRLSMNKDLFDVWQRTEKTIVFVTHDVSEAARLASRTLIMSARPGRIVHQEQRSASPESFAEWIQGEEYVRMTQRLENQVVELLAPASPSPERY